MWWFKQKKGKVRQPHIETGQDNYTFRRSRTLTGTTSANVQVSVLNRSQLKTPRLKAHELHQERAKVVRMLFGLGLAMVVIGFFLVNYIGDFGITPISPGHETARPPTLRYEQSLQAYFNERPFERFGFLLNTGQLDTFMKQRHSELLQFDARRQWYGGNAVFTIDFRQPLLVWQTGNKHFYVDSEGVAFEYDHFRQALVAVEDQSGISPDTGSSVASQRFIKFLGRLVGAVNDGNKGRVSAVIIPSSTRQIDLRLEGRGYPVKTHIDRDPLEQAGDILAALRYFDERAITPQYVDVRVSGKAYYK
jgi:hypothetical protein